MKKQAILIMAHQNIWTLEKIIRLLDYEYFDIFVHIDKKSAIEIEDIKNIKLEKSEVFPYKNIDVRWADVSMIECELFLLEKASEKNDYKYYHLISGEDMPIKRAEEIFGFFNDNDKEFIHSHYINIKTFDRINNYNIFTRYRRKSIIFLIINRLSLTIQKILKINRNLDILSIKTGSNWFSITNELAQYLIENKESLLVEYEHTVSGDEMFLQTLVDHSKFKENLYKPVPNNLSDSMRHIDWDRGAPYTFRTNDYEELINSDCMFARKFNENVDNEIIEKLYETLK